VQSPSPSRSHLVWEGSTLEIAARRVGWRTEIKLFRDGRRVGEGSGVFRVLLPVPEAGQPEHAPPDEPKPPTVLVLSLVPGVIGKTFLLVPKPQGESDEAAERLPEGMAEVLGFANAERYEFEPPSGTLAARLRAFQRRYPKLYASRHVALAVGRAVVALLGIAVVLQLLLQRVIGWILDWLPTIDLPSIPWPDINLPDIALPPWLLVVLGTAKYWIPILIAIGVAVREARRRAAKQPVAKRQMEEPTEAMRTVDPEKHQQRRLSIIGAAVDLFATKGFAATTTAEICRAAGISSGNLFHYFPSSRRSSTASLRSTVTSETSCSRRRHQPRSVGGADGGGRQARRGGRAPDHGWAARRGRGAGAPGSRIRRPARGERPADDAGHRRSRRPARGRGPRRPGPAVWDGRALGDDTDRRAPRPGLPRARP
jgi:hypothetical protein